MNCPEGSNDDHGLNEKFSKLASKLGWLKDGESLDETIQRISSKSKGKKSTSHRSITDKENAQGAAWKRKVKTSAPAHDGSPLQPKQQETQAKLLQLKKSKKANPSTIKRQQRILQVLDFSSDESSSGKESEVVTFGSNVGVLVDATPDEPMSDSLTSAGSCSIIPASEEESSCISNTGHQRGREENGRALSLASRPLNRCSDNNGSLHLQMSVDSSVSLSSEGSRNIIRPDSSGAPSPRQKHYIPAAQYSVTTPQNNKCGLPTKAGGLELAPGHSGKVTPTHTSAHMSVMHTPVGNSRRTPIHSGPSSCCNSPSRPSVASVKNTPVRSRNTTPSQGARHTPKRNNISPISCAALNHNNASAPYAQQPRNHTDSNHATPQSARNTAAPRTPATLKSTPAHRVGTPQSTPISPSTQNLRSGMPSGPRSCKKPDTPKKTPAKNGTPNHRFASPHLGQEVSLRTQSPSEKVEPTTPQVLKTNDIHERPSSIRKTTPAHRRATPQSERVTTVLNDSTGPRKNMVKISEDAITSTRLGMCGLGSADENMSVPLHRNTSLDRNMHLSKESKDTDGSLLPASRPFVHDMKKTKPLNLKQEQQNASRKKHKEKGRTKSKLKSRLKEVIDFSSDSDDPDTEIRQKVTKDLLLNLRETLNRTGFSSNMSSLSSSVAESTHSSNLSTEMADQSDAGHINHSSLKTTLDNSVAASHSQSSVFAPCSLESQEDAQHVSLTQSLASVTPDGITVIPCSQDSPKRLQDHASGGCDAVSPSEDIDKTAKQNHQNGKLSLKKPKPSSKGPPDTKKLTSLKCLDLFPSDEDSPVTVKSQVNHDELDNENVSDSLSSLSETQSSQTAVADIDILSQRLDKILGFKKQKKKHRKPAKSVSENTDLPQKSPGSLHVLNEKLHEILAPPNKSKRLIVASQALFDHSPEFSSDATPDSSYPASPSNAHNVIGSMSAYSSDSRVCTYQPGDLGRHDGQHCQDISLQVSFTEEENTPDTSLVASPKLVSMSLQVSMAPSPQYTSDDSSRDCSPAVNSLQPCSSLQTELSNIDASGVDVCHRASVDNSKDGSMLSTDSTPDAYKSAINQTVFVTPPQTVAVEHQQDATDQLAYAQRSQSGGTASWQDSGNSSAGGLTYNSSMEVSNVTQNLNSVLEKCISPNSCSNRKKAAQVERSVESGPCEAAQSTPHVLCPELCDQSLQVSLADSNLSTDDSGHDGNQISHLSFDSNLDASVCEPVKSPGEEHTKRINSDECSSSPFAADKIPDATPKKNGQTGKGRSAANNERELEDSSEEDDLENFFSRMKAPTREKEKHYMSLHDFIVESSEESSEDDDEALHRRTNQALESHKLNKLNSYRPNRYHYSEMTSSSSSEDEYDDRRHGEKSSTHSSRSDSLPTIEAPVMKQKNKHTPMYEDSLSEDEFSDDAANGEEEEEIAPCSSSESDCEVDETSIRRPRIIQLDSDDDDDDDVFKTPAFKPRTPGNKGAKAVISTTTPFLTPLERRLGLPVTPLPHHIERTGVQTPGRVHVAVVHDVTLPARPNSTGHLSQFQPFLKSLGSDVPDCAKHPEAVKYVKNFKKHREELTKKLYDLYNETVFDKKLPTDMLVKWNSHLLKTAGYCAYKRIGGNNAEARRTARIELSVKVCDSAERVRDTLIHEMCHAAVWLIHATNGGHGHLWKAYACRAMKVHRDLPSIARCHTYEINYKFTYQCTKCSYRLGRHSKSLDTNRKVCGYCHSPFELIVNSAQGSRTPGMGSVPKTPRTPGPFALYVKEHYGTVKLRTPGIQHKDVMKQLGADFQRLKTQ